MNAMKKLMRGAAVMTAKSLHGGSGGGQAVILVGCRFLHRV